jgi:hypothetical protein
MERPLKEITLPSGRTASITTYLLRGEVKEIERQRWAGAKVVQGEDGQVNVVDVPVDQKIIQDDALVAVCVKKLDEDTVITREMLDNLSDADFNFILAEINKAITEKKSPKKN